VREDEDVYLVIEAARVEEAVRQLVRVGLDRIKGFAEPGAIEEYQRTGGKAGDDGRGGRRRRKQKIAQGALVLDVRRRSDEFDPGHIPGAMNISYTRLAERVKELPRDRRLWLAARAAGAQAGPPRFYNGRGFAGR